MKHAIVTATNAAHGGFLIDHWLRSLMDNVDLRNIDVHVLDYGLTPRQVEILGRAGILLKPCLGDGHIVTVRYRDTAQLLSGHSYDQVLLIDSGDIIFQDDLGPLFGWRRETLRGYCEELVIIDYNRKYVKGFLAGWAVEEIRGTLKGRRPINGGVIVGPAPRIKSLAEEVYDLVERKDVFGPDQTAVNYILYRDGFESLPSKYNMHVLFSGDDFRLKEGVFYSSEGEKIPVVHNAGGSAFFRGIENFGYGPGYNRSKRMIRGLLRGLGLAKKGFVRYR